MTVLDKKRSLTSLIPGSVAEAIVADYGPRLEELSIPERLELAGYLSFWCQAVAFQAQEDPEMEEGVHWSHLDWAYDPSGDVENILDICDDLDLCQAQSLIGAIASFCAD